MTSQIILGPIVGGLSDRSANLWARADGPGTLHGWLARNPDLGDAAPAGDSLPLRPEDGFAGVVPLSHLQPETIHYYALSLDPATKPPPSEFHQFTTFPRPKKLKPFQFAFGSCFRPVGAGSGKAFTAIDRLRREQGLEFILLIGDQVYSDDRKYNGLDDKVACTVDDYRLVYQHVWANQPFRDMLCNLPVFMTLDDHEVDNDWRWTDSFRHTASIALYDTFTRFITGRPKEEWRLDVSRVQNALQAYWEHQGMHAPPMSLPPQVDENGQYVLERHAPGSLAYSFTCGAAAFFILDTRSMRVKKMFGEKRMLGDGQWNILKDWLLAARDKYPLKFIVTSASIMFNMWADLPRDRWAGFPAERDELFRFIGANGIPGVYFLAGDLHSAHAIETTIGSAGSRVPVWEFCSTPFEQKCNKWARLMYAPIRSRYIGRQEVKFTAGVNNFGVVSVTYPGGEPSVEYKLYDENGDILWP